MASVGEFWNRAPLVTKYLTAGTFGLSILCHTGIIPSYLVVFYLPYLLKFPPEIWRLVTCFLITGPQLGVIFDTYFLWTNGSKLETTSPRFTKPGDFFFYVLFLCVVIMFLNVIYVGGIVFTSALGLALTWTNSQDDRGGQAHFYVINIPANLAPYAYLVLTLIINGPQAAMVQATGIVAAHLWEFLTKLYPEFGGGSELIHTPNFIYRLFGSTERTVEKRGYGEAHRQADFPGTSSGSSSSSVLPEAWKTRGTGHRLGGS